MKKYILLALVLMGTLAAHAQYNNKWEKLFNGITTNGWVSANTPTGIQ